MTRLFRTEAAVTVKHELAEVQHFLAIFAASLCVFAHGVPEKITRKRNGKSHAYWASMESHRTPNGPRHRTVAYLGELDEIDCGGWAQLVRRVDNKPLEILQPTSSGRELQLRCVTKPDESQRILLKRLGIEIPSRLGRPRWREVIKKESPCSQDF